MEWNGNVLTVIWKYGIDRIRIFNTKIPYDTAVILIWLFSSDQLDHLNHWIVEKQTSRGYSVYIIELEEFESQDSKKGKRHETELEGRIGRYW